MKKLIHWNEAKCIKCKTKWDLSTLRERKDYLSGFCPKCKGKLVTIKEIKKVK